MDTLDKPPPSGLGSNRQGRRSRAVEWPLPSQSFTERVLTGRCSL